MTCTIQMHSFPINQPASLIIPLCFSDVHILSLQLGCIQFLLFKTLHIIRGIQALFYTILKAVFKSHPLVSFSPIATKFIHGDQGMPKDSEDGYICIMIAMPDDD